MNRPPLSAPSPPGLGIDVGGRATRWVLAQADGRLLARGEVEAFSGNQIAHPAGHAAVERILGDLRQAVQAALLGGGLAAGPVSAHTSEAARPLAVQAAWAAVTGFDEGSGPELHTLWARQLQLAPERLLLRNDVEMACRLSLERATGSEAAPGSGFFLYAGTGSIAWFLDAQGQAHRVGGRGSIVGDHGAGHWIAREALSRLWQQEDEAPGSGNATPLGRELAAAVGGPTWNDARRFLSSADRGQVGLLALAVARAAHQGDGRALALLRDAGQQLAQLVAVLARRFGRQPLAMAGGVLELHPALREAMDCALPSGLPRVPAVDDVALAAAVRAAGAGPLAPPGTEPT
ncbi:MAG: ATPase [Rubrivivax sp.]|nr:ATPase [Rubrivivax sp.]